MNRQEKTAKSNIAQWQRSTQTRLSDAYGKHSTKKDHAFEYCQRLCKMHNGTDLKIIKHNSFIFTAGFQFVDQDTGVVRFVYITPSYDTTVDM